MTTDLTQLPPEDERGYQIRERDRDLIVRMHKHFDTSRAIDRWAFHLVRAAPGPYQHVFVDLSGFTLISSTIIAGLVHLRDHHGRHQTPLVLVNASDRVRRSLEMTKLDQLFEFLDNPDSA